MNFGGFLRSTGPASAVTNPAPLARKASLLRRLPIHWGEILAGRMTALKEATRNQPSVAQPGWARRLLGQRLAASSVEGSLSKTKRNLPSVGHMGWTLTLWVQRLGVSGAVGLGLCAFAVMFYLSCWPKQVR